MNSVTEIEWRESVVTRYCKSIDKPAVKGQPSGVKRIQEHNESNSSEAALDDRTFDNRKR
jgi:hypothetical protein